MKANKADRQVASQQARRNCDDRDAANAITTAIAPAQWPGSCSAAKFRALAKETTTREGALPLPVDPETGTMLVTRTERSDNLISRAAKKLKEQLIKKKRKQLLETGIKPGISC